MEREAPREVLRLFEEHVYAGALGGRPQCGS